MTLPVAESGGVPAPPIALGAETVVDAFGCDPARLRSTTALEGLFGALVRDLGLSPIGAARWHVFPGEGGVTGMLMLQESHLTCHTFPEAGFAALNLYACRGAAPWPWAEGLREHLGASGVAVRRLERGAPPCP